MLARSGWSTAEQALLSLVDEEVGDDRPPPRPQPAARSPILGLQLFELLASRRGGEQGLQFRLSLLERFLPRHEGVLFQGRGVVGAPVRTHRARAGGESAPLLAGTSLVVPRALALRAGLPQALTPWSRLPSQVKLARVRLTFRRVTTPAGVFRSLYMMLGVAYATPDSRQCF